MFSFKKKASAKSIEASLPNTISLYGIEIRKLPIGAYLEMLKELQDMPQDLLQSCFPDMQPDEIFEELKSLNQEKLLFLMQRAFTVAPEHLMRAAAKLLRADYDYIANSLSPLELMEVIEGFWEINRLGELTAALKQKLQKLNIAGAAKSGFSSLSRQG